METLDTTSLNESSGGDIATGTTARRDPWRKWMWWALAILLVGQIYFFQEMFAALLIFTVIFLVVAMVAGSIYLVGRAGQAGISAAEPVARRGIAVADDLSRKTFRRPRSAPAP